MYLRVTHVQFDPEQYDDIIPMVQAVTAAVRQLPGYQHIHQGIDRATGAAVSVSVWDTEEHARFSRDALGDAVTRLLETGAQFEPPRIYEIVE